MWVTELFHSVQGESSYVGLPCTFVRLTGCNLRCVWCDSTYTFSGGEKMTLDEVIQQVEAYGCKLVEVTGGEPLVQQEVYPLTERLCDLSYTVLIETGGSLPIWHLDDRIIRIMDLKPPGSGHEHSNLWENIAHLRPVDEVKFVILDRRDFDWASAVIQHYDLTRRAKVLFSPVHGALDPRELAQWLLQSKLTARLQIQLHKYLWGADVRGV